MLAGEIDLVVSHAKLGVDPERMQVLPLAEGFTSNVCCSDHPLHQGTAPSWAQIVSQPWILQLAFTPSCSKFDRIIVAYRSEATGWSPVIEVKAAAAEIPLLTKQDYLWIMARREALAWQATSLVVVLPSPEVLLRGHMCCMGLRGSSAMSLATVFSQALQDCSG